jgi:hypothetical protein
MLLTDVINQTSREKVFFQNMKLEVSLIEPGQTASNASDPKKVTYVRLPNSNGGSSWPSDTSKDQMFRIYGN